MPIKSLHTLTANKYFVPYGIPLILYCLFALILMVILLKAPKEGELANSSTPVETSVVENVNFNLISSWHLFGFDKEAKFQKVKDANIKLVGIIFDNSNSKAILLVNAKERVLHAGDKIDNNYSIQKIEQSRVIVGTSEGAQELDLFSSLENSNKNVSKNPSLANMNDANQAFNTNNDTGPASQPDDAIAQPNNVNDDAAQAYSNAAIGNNNQNAEDLPKNVANKIMQLRRGKF